MEPRHQSDPVARYREYAPCAALRQSVRAFFSFTVPDRSDSASRPLLREVLFGADDSFCSPLFADGHVCIVFNLARVCHAGGIWRVCPTGSRGEVLGAMTEAGAAPLDQRPEMVGAYLRAGWASSFTGVPAGELTDLVVAMEDLWGTVAFEMAARLSEIQVDTERIGLLEWSLLQQMIKARKRTTQLDIPGLTVWMNRQHGRLTIERMASAAGVSRQHLTRVFREVVGVTPKLYCQLARFQAGLAYAGCGEKVGWAQAAVAMGYADQSHMIADFRRFSSLTPEGLARNRWFHPFIERARAAGAP